MDSGGWYSVLVAGDVHYTSGTAYFGHLIRLRIPVITSDFVLDEVITRLRYDAGHASATAFLDLIDDSIVTGILSVISIGPSELARAKATFRQYDDVKLSFTDCTSFAILEERKVDAVFGYDAHFEMMGHLLPPK